MQIQYFAQLKDAARCSQEDYDPKAGETAADLYAQLSERYGFKLDSHEVRVALDDEFASMQSPLQGHNKVVFIPPVSGG